MATDNVIYFVDLTNRRLGWSRGPDTPINGGSWNDWPVGGYGAGRPVTVHWLSSAGAALADTQVTMSTVAHIKTRTTQTTGVWITTDVSRQASLCTTVAAATSGSTRTQLNALATVINTNPAVPRVTV